MKAATFFAVVLLADDSPLMTGNYGVFRDVHDAGQVRILAISGSERHPGLPDVPTVREQGFDWSVMSFNAVIAPAGIPPDRRKLLEDAFRAVMAEAEIRDRLTGMGSVVSFTPGAELDARMRRERASWTRLVRDARIEVN
jgi:tripartite-type tricarboxylate transporter receptor subunit TctC